MKEVTLKIPDNKLAFFMELTKQLGFVRSRIRKANEHPERLLAWDEVQNGFAAFFI